ncbi:Glutamine--fructose-6-phosphate aminotransferase [isomerizing] [Chlamydia avium]|uniref:Glutamine--fructose-6-phosphate aminotransferase [isomerizing] n=2 Tax=Chlamydia avium TaxID=1457141 RepID=W8JMA3_9CHLA|nr:glutamine--fructose-6-phosphate transaminase (isomerizing) [Chlamydia avium]AHK63424.1 Glutamine--fructose-6-phosphate aminotransferase (isomerizing) [Chlamydia avium 10DC88]EPP37871.1 glutamine-fructose-6-phosphate transaminase [Chlamydia psittaci 10_743_SC13]EPP38058.1 glutamine-fructose-6-phosphate transaminase [Chlamydia avium]VVT43022.1 Glutamine--fructose-6-phosphate aminotransferase [isomerizing] [Chlamydia avium]
MCGIFGYLGSKSAIPLIIEGLEKLEYRGYDSTGLATIHAGQLFVKKTTGRVDELKCFLKCDNVLSNLAIGHTRWATHGVPTVDNAHPHVDYSNSCAIVHNGIIENFKELKSQLLTQGILFTSDTDSEVIVQLFSSRYQLTQDLLHSFSWTLSQLKGSFACGLIHKDHPDVLLCAAQDSPLLIGLGEKESFIASDTRAFLKHTKNVQSLASGELAVIGLGTVETYNFALKSIQKEIRQVAYTDSSLDKQGYSYYMLKEIYEQPDVLEHLIDKYFSDQGHIRSNFLEGFSLENFNAISIVACGSSYHAGLLAKYIIESLVSIPVYIEVASEFRYRQAYIGENTLAILISQSGETADTLAALKEFRRRQVTCILGICNVEESALATGVDYCLFLEAGIEVSVASTKAFTAQLLLFILFGLKLAMVKGALKLDDHLAYGKSILEIPELCRRLLANEHLHSWALQHTHEDRFIFLGRRFMYPVCMEAALKLKEIAYVEANCYPAGEMKHGPIALISTDSPVITFCGDPIVYDKMVGCIMEVKARRARVTALASESQQDIAAVSDSQIYIPNSHPLVAPILYTIAGQIMAYTMALQKGNEIDCPRNLAKSVTVE